MLIPKDDGLGETDGSEQITFERFVKFISPFERLPDDLVNPRYHYGELRLSRLNMYAKVFLRKLTFHHVEAQWGSYLGQFLTPLLSVFAIISVALNAMQVQLGVQGLLQDSEPPWTYFAYVSRWFSCTILIIIATTITFFSSLIVFMLLHEFWFAKSVLHQRQKSPATMSKEFRSGVV